MAEIVYLTANEALPERGAWLLLEENQEGLFKSRSQHMTDSVMRHDHHPDVLPLEQAIEKAQRDAEVFEIPTIYVRKTRA